LLQTSHGASVARLSHHQNLNGQALAAFGATSIDDSAATASFHAYQKAMGTGATSFRRLVSAFHNFSKKLGPEKIRETNDYLKFSDALLSFIHTLFCFTNFSLFANSLPCG
jgi:hypothetical protein